MTAVLPPAKAETATAPGKQPAGESRVTRRVLNVKLLIASVVFLVVSAPSVYFWHQFQLERLTTTLLTRVEELVEEEQWWRAYKLVRQYVRHHPQDPKGWALWAQISEERDMEPKQVIKRYQQAVGLDQGNRELRVSLAELLMKHGDYAVASVQAEELLEKDPNDPDGLRLLAEAEVRKYYLGGRDAKPLTDLVETLEQIRQKIPAEPTVAHFLAHLYRERMQRPSETKRAEIADGIMDDMVKATGGQDYEAYLERFKYRRRYRLAGAEGDIAKAAELAPEEYDVLFLAGQDALTQGQKAKREGRRTEAAQLFSRARDYFQQAIDVDPEDEKAHLGHGSAYVADGKAGRAIQTWQAGLKEVGRHNIELNGQLVNTMIALKQFDDCEKQLDTLQDALRKEGPNISGDRLRIARNIVNFLRAKWHAGKDEHREALALLQGVVTGLEGVQTPQIVNQRFQAAMLMGDSHLAMGQWEEAAGAYQKASVLRPEDATAKEKAGDAWASVGLYERAGTFYQQAAASEAEDSPELWLKLVQTKLQHQMSLPTAQQDWRWLEQNLTANVPSAVAASWQRRMLLSDYLVARHGDQGKPQAMELMRSAEQLFPGVPQLFQMLTVKYEKLGDSAAADRCLAHLRKITNQSLSYYQVHAELLVMRGRSDQAEEVLTGAFDELPEQFHPQLQQTMARLRVQQGRASDAYAQLLSIHQRDQNNIDVVRQLADLALQRGMQSGQFDDLKKWETELRRLEGEDSNYWRYFQARRLLHTAPSVESEQFRRAVNLQLEIQARRSEWAEAHLLKALLAQRQGHSRGAIIAYRNALDLGEKRLWVYEQLTELLMRENRYDEIDKVLREVPEAVRESSPRLNAVQINVKLRQGKKDEAVALAKQLVERRPKDPDAHVRLGSVLLNVDKKTEAEQSYQKAVRLAPDSIGAWNELLSFYLRTEQKDMALRILDNFPDNEKISGAQRLFLIAQGYELIGEFEQAEKFYEQAKTADPKNVHIALKSASFYARRDRKKGEQMFRDLHRRFPEERRVRRALAAFLFSLGEEKNAREAMQLLGGDAIDGEQSPVDMRIKANYLWMRGGKQNRRIARGIFEELVADPSTAAPGDIVSLARINEAEGRIEDARNLLIQLTKHPASTPSHLAVMVDFLLRNDEGRRAGTAGWLKQLIRAAPDNLATYSLRARWLKANGRTDEIQDLVESFARDQLRGMSNRDNQVQFCSAVGDLYSSVELWEPARAWYTAMTRLKPEAYYALARLHAMSGDLEEAIALCAEKAATDPTPRSAMLMAGLLANGTPNAAEYSAADPTLRKALQEHPRNLGLLFAVALVRTNQKRVDEAIELYKRILEVQPRHVAALNNLAYILSEMPDHYQESLKYIDRAIDIDGPKPALLDTKGMIMLERSPSEALALLEEATLLPSDDPRFEFHKAVAYLRTGNQAKARQSFLESKRNGLEQEQLTQTERQLLVELNKTL